MALWKRAVDSVYGLLGGPARQSAAMEDAVEEIRAQMLESIGDAGSAAHPKVARRIRYAQDLQALWYLRGDLMAVLAAQYGEAQARETMQEISQEFEGLLPGGLSSRPSPLG